jgi:hypothetical protein
MQEPIKRTNQTLTENAISQDAPAQRSHIGSGQVPPENHRLILVSFFYTLVRHSYERSACDHRSFN